MLATAIVNYGREIENISGDIQNLEKLSMLMIILPNASYFYTNIYNVSKMLLLK